MIAVVEKTAPVLAHDLVSIPLFWKSKVYREGGGVRELRKRRGERIVQWSTTGVFDKESVIIDSLLTDCSSVFNLLSVL